MKLRLIFSCFLFLSLASFAQVRPDTLLTKMYSNSDALHWDRYMNADYEAEVDTPRCGTLYQKGETWSGNTSNNDEYIWTESPCKDGKIDGKWKQYFDHRPWVMIECDYTDGKRNGNYFRYDKRGKVLESRQYKNDSLDGECKFYDSNGKLLATEYYLNGKKDKCWQSSEESVCYSNGLKNGRWIIWEDANKKRKKQDLIMKDDLVVSGTFYDAYSEAAVKRDSVLKNHWTYKQSFAGADKKTQTIEGQMIIDPDTAAYIYPFPSRITGSSFRMFIPDGKWTWTENNHRSTTWSFNVGRLTNKVLRISNDSGAVAHFWSYHHPKMKVASTKYRRAQYIGNGVNVHEYVVNAVVRRRDVYSPAPESQKQILLSSEKFDASGNSVFLLNSFTDGSDSARWIFSEQDARWKCNWTNADSSRYGLKYYTPLRQRTGQWLETDKKAGTVTVANYDKSKLSGAYSVRTIKGSLIQQGSFEMNVKTGEWIEKDNEGFYHKGNYVGGKRDGVWTEYYDNCTKKKSSGMYKNGVKTGKWKNWKASGKKARTKKYAS